MLRELDVRPTRTRRVLGRGATAVEYALMVSLIALVIIVAVSLIGTSLSTFFVNAAGSI